MGLRVLIVDDNQVARLLLSSMLSMAGHEPVAEAENLKSTLAAYQKHFPDLVTLDLSLAEGDGLTVLRMLRKLDSGARVLIVSGNTQRQVMEQVMKEGALGVLAKPFTAEDLAKSLEGIEPR
ncbi:MAG: response regulator [Elusimicrobiota bacterium]|jgi:two-component system chemotaxis response regulator CheY